MCQLNLFRLLNRFKPLGIVRMMDVTDFNTKDACEVFLNNKKGSIIF